MCVGGVNVCVGGCCEPANYNMFTGGFEHLDSQPWRYVVLPGLGIAAVNVGIREDEKGPAGTPPPGKYGIIPKSFPVR